LVDISEWAPDDPVVSFEAMRKEVAAYDNNLTARPFAVAGTKLDIGGNQARLDQLRTYCKRRRLRLFPISAVTREGLDTLVTFLGKRVDALRRAPCATSS
jgi:GTP-binding protein